MGSIENDLFRLAGEYAVAAQMALCGWHVSPTVGNFPEVDLVAYNPKTNKRLTVQVKAGHGKWRIGTAKFDGKQWYIEGIATQADIYVLADLPYEGNQNFTFYIVPTNDLKGIVNQYAPVKYGRRRKNEQPCWINATQADHQDEWHKIVPFKDQWSLLNAVAR